MATQDRVPYLARSPRRPRTKSTSHSRERFFWGAFGVIAVLAVWQLLNVSNVVSPTLVSSPIQVVQAAHDEWSQGLFWSDLWATVSVWLLGFVIATGVGVAVGLLGGAFRIVSYVVDPWLRILYSFPELAIIPLLIVWLGLGTTLRVTIVFMSSVFYIALNTVSGVRSVNPKLLRVARLYNTSRLRTFATVILPGATPYIMTGLRLGASRALVGAVVAEFVASTRGIGYMINTAGSVLDTPVVMWGVAELGIIGILSGELLRRLHNHFDGWRAG